MRHGNDVATSAQSALTKALTDLEAEKQQKRELESSVLARTKEAEEALSQFSSFEEVKNRELARLEDELLRTRSQGSRDDPEITRQLEVAETERSILQSSLSKKSEESERFRAEADRVKRLADKESAARVKAEREAEELKALLKVLMVSILSIILHCTSKAWFLHIESPTLRLGQFYHTGGGTWSPASRLETKPPAANHGRLRLSFSSIKLANRGRLRLSFPFMRLASW